MDFDKDGHNPTVYGSIEEMRYFESPERLLDDPEDRKECCGMCALFDGDHCTKEWNNMDKDYYLPWRDDKEPEDWCECFEKGEKWI